MMTDSEPRGLQSVRRWFALACFGGNHYSTMPADRTSGFVHPAWLELIFRVNRLQPAEPMPWGIGNRGHWSLWNLLRPLSTEKLPVCRNVVPFRKYLFLFYFYWIHFCFPRFSGSVKSWDSTATRRTMELLVLMAILLGSDNLSRHGRDERRKQKWMSLAHFSPAH